MHSHVCGCSVRTPACFSTFWLSEALRSQAGEWRGHIRGSFRAPTHHASTILPPAPPTTPTPTFSSSTVIPHHPSTSSSSSPRGDGVSRPLGGEGAQGGKVPLWLTAGRSGFCRHGRGGRTHGRMHADTSRCVRGRKKESIYLSACVDIVYVNT